jgi:hypothetical protein
MAKKSKIWGFLTFLTFLCLILVLAMQAMEGMVLFLFEGLF